MVCKHYQQKQCNNLGTQDHKSMLLLLNMYHVKQKLSLMGADTTSDYNVLARVISDHSHKIVTLNNAVYAILPSNPLNVAIR